MSNCKAVCLKFIFGKDDSRKGGYTPECKSCQKKGME